MPAARKVTPDPAAPSAGDQVADIDRVCAEIVAHRHTGRLGDIIEAVLAAASTGPSSLRWQIKLDPLGPEYAGQRITEDSISLAAVVTAENAAGHSWKTLSPTESAKDCHSLIVAWLVEDRDLLPAQALEVAKRVTLDDIASMVSTYEVIHGPKEDGTPSGESSG